MMYKGLFVCLLVVSSSILEVASEKSDGAGDKHRNSAKETGKKAQESLAGEHRDGRTFDLIGLLLQGILGGGGLSSGGLYPGGPFQNGYQKPGRCPAVRPQCPIRNQFGPPRPCVSDDSCPGRDKCCFDRCLSQRVCKPVSVIG